MPNNSVSAIAIDENGNKWIGTIGGGLAVFNEGGIVSVEDKPEMLVENFYLYQNYPNPFNPTTTITYTLPERCNVTIKVYNIIGQEVIILVNDLVETGTHELAFDASKLPRGVYTYRLQAGEYVESKKLIFIK